MVSYKETALPARRQGHRELTMLLVIWIPVEFSLARRLHDGTAHLYILRMMSHYLSDVQTSVVGTQDVWQQQYIAARL